MSIYSERAIEQMERSSKLTDEPRAWLVLARAAVWALLAIAVAVEALHEGEV